jgi:hypothetical protein
MRKLREYLKLRYQVASFEWSFAPGKETGDLAHLTGYIARSMTGLRVLCILTTRYGGASLVLPFLPSDENRIQIQRG